MTDLVKNKRRKHKPKPKMAIQNMAKPVENTAGNASTEQPKAKLDLKAIALGSLVGQVREEVIQFFHDGKIESVDVRIKQLPFSVTEPLYDRLHKNENVIAEWIALALVDEDNKCYLTKKQVEQNFTQSLASAIFSTVTSIDAALKYVQGKTNSR